MNTTSGTGLPCVFGSSSVRQEGSLVLGILLFTLLQQVCGSAAREQRKVQGTSSWCWEQAKRGHFHRSRRFQFWYCCRGCCSSFCRCDEESREYRSLRIGQIFSSGTLMGLWLVLEMRSWGKLFEEAAYRGCERLHCPVHVVQQGANSLSDAVKAYRSFLVIMAEECTETLRITPKRSRKGAWTRVWTACWREWRPELPQIFVDQHFALLDPQLWSSQWGWLEEGACEIRQERQRPTFSVLSFSGVCHIGAESGALKTSSPQAITVEKEFEPIYATEHENLHSSFYFAIPWSHVHSQIPAIFWGCSYEEAIAHNSCRLWSWAKVLSAGTG